jgi:hypothetical protein
MCSSFISPLLGANNGDWNETHAITFWSGDLGKYSEESSLLQ